jgi:hypothetical protein
MGIGQTRYVTLIETFDLEEHAGECIYDRSGVLCNVHVDFVP